MSKKHKKKHLKNKNKKTIKNTKNTIQKTNDNIKEEKRISFFKDTFIYNLLFVTLMIFLIEIIFKLLSDFKILNYATVRVFFSVFIISFVVTFLSFLTKRKWLKNTINILFVFLYSIYSWLQLGFLNFLGVYISFKTSNQAGAVKDYIFDFLASFKGLYYIIFIPLIITIIYYILLRKTKYNKISLSLKKIIFFLTTIVVSVLIYISTLYIPFMQNKLQTKSNIELIKNPSVPTLAVHEFGVAFYGVLDLKNFVFPVEEVEMVFEAEFLGENLSSKREVSNVLENIEETKKVYINLNNYFASRKVTDYNDYTGMFEGKNVIVVLMESVNEAIINEEYYPNFTKLYNNGWHWENHYSPRNACATGNNEFSVMTSLYSIYNTCTSNTYKNNTYFEAIFNLFNNKGYETTSMHNFSEWYYYRSTIHPNMGSGKYYGSSDLNIHTPDYYGEWTSDEEFLEKAMDIILNSENNKPFMTFLTTVTSHQPYSKSSTYGDMYKDYFKEEGYSTNVSRYLSKLKVLDNAIGIMLEKLEESGQLKNTVIVMIADHYPYGLNSKELSEIIYHGLDDYDNEKTPFLIYNSEMEPKTFSEYTSYINLLPTLANIMNLDYDPRLFMGTDLLSDDYESLVAFADGSWKNEYAYYNASKSKITYYGDITYTNEEIQKINNEITLKMEMSTSAIKNNYFEYLNEKIKEYEEIASDKNE